MHTFKDVQGREWSVELNIPTERRIRTATGVNLKDADCYANLANDSVLLASVLVSFLEPQIQQRGMTPEQFEAAFDGDVLEAAFEALMQAIIDFFPKSRQPSMRRLHEKGKALNSPAALEAMEAQATKQMDDRLRLLGIDSSSSAKLSSESAIPRGPSES